MQTRWMRAVWMSAAVSGLLLGVAPNAPARERLFVLTDISNEPDDEESLVRLLVYANEFDLEGLVATTSTHLRSGPREDIIRRGLDAYAQVRGHLLMHAPGYPAASALREVTATGQPGYGMAAVGAGRNSPGSRLLHAAAEREDDRPLWVSIWGGANTLAQVLDDARRELGSEQLAALVARLRVYSISDQDDAGSWLRREFPGLFYIVSPSTQDWKEYWRATWAGISGDRLFRNGPGHAFALVDNPWLEENIIRGHGPLGALYPKLIYIMEGDTPSFLGLIDNGLGWHVSPSFGGWGGRYAFYQASGESRPIWTNNQDSRDTVTADNGQTQCTDAATIWRWRVAFQHDFAARMDWCVAETFSDANHNPVVLLNGDASRRVIEISARPGETVALSATGSRDPDGNPLAYRWFIYREAGTFAGALTLQGDVGETTAFTVPEPVANIAGPQTIHVILEVRDDGRPELYAYRRAIVSLVPKPAAGAVGAASPAMPQAGD